ncbi:hypothetical protein [Fodinibius salicampi]|nr:hypothetical protein [Fodinibius salicampi]
MDRILLKLGLAIILMGLIGCSASAPTVDSTANQQAPQEELEWMPEWFSEQEITDNDTTITAYATAIDSDPERAVSKAQAWGIARLKREVSDRLENIRTNIIDGEGQTSELKDPSFLIEFRKAADAVEEVSHMRETAKREVTDHQGIRGFAKVQVNKAELIEAIDARLSSYEGQWETIKNAQFFSSF